MTQAFLSDEAQIRSLAFDGQRVDLFRLLKDNRTLFTRTEYGKSVIAISNLTRENYLAAKTKLEAEVKKREQNGIDHSKDYKI